MPAPEPKGGEEVAQRDRVWNRHYFPRRVVEKFWQSHDQTLTRRHAQTAGRVTIGHVLEKGLRIDRAPRLPIEHRRDSFDPRVEIERPGVAAVEAIHRSLNGKRLQCPLRFTRPV